MLYFYKAIYIGYFRKIEQSYVHNNICGSVQKVGFKCKKHVLLMQNSGYNKPINIYCTLQHFQIADKIRGILYSAQSM